MLDSFRSSFAAFTGGKVLGQFLRHAAGSAVLKGVSMLLGLGGSGILARVLRPEQFGAYSFALSTITLLALPVQFGLPQLIIREVAKYQLMQEWSLMRGLLLRANQLVVFLAFLFGGFLLGSLLLFGSHSLDLDIPTFLCASFLLPFAALSQIRGATLQGLRHVVQGQVPESIIRPGSFLILVMIWVRFAPLRPWSAMALQLAAAIIAFLVGVMLLLRYLPKEIRGVKSSTDSQAWLRSLIPLSMTDALQLVNVQADLILLGLLRGSGDVGLYRAAALIAYQISVGLTVVNMVIGPFFARLYYANDMIELQRVVTQSVRLIWIIAIPVALACIVAGDPIISLIFGKAYAGGATSLAILAVGQAVNGITGPGTLLLNMTGNERDVTRAITLAAAINVGVNLLLIPRFGILGAAITTTISQVVANIWLTVLLKQRLGIHVFRFQSRLHWL